jgi:hypothetical protein
MLIDNAASDRCGILHRHVPAVEIDHLRPHLAMNGIQRGLTDGGNRSRFDGRQIRTSKRRTAEYLPGCVTDYGITWFFGGSNGGLCGRWAAHFSPCIFAAATGVVLEFSSLSGGIMLQGIFQPTHLILAFPIFLALFFGVLYLAVRVVRAAWKR